MANATIGPKVTQRTTAAGILEFFHERFDMAHAPDSELQYLAECSSAVICMASSLALLIEGVESLMADDRLDGSLRRDVPFGVLPHLAAQAELIRQVATLSCLSNGELRQRLLDRLKVERARRGHGDDNLSREAA